jgi:hypothetical protein
MTNKDFAGDDHEFEFAVGSIQGVRTWSLDGQGRLTGVSHQRFWKPGENVSVCATQQGVCEDEACTHCKSARKRERHHFDPTCQCGFWAYYEHSFSSNGRVPGVIEGYGRTTVGTKGFRSEKARVLALARKNSGWDPMPRVQWERLQQLYPEAEFFDRRRDMVAAYPSVLGWDSPSEEFWTPPPVKQPKDHSGYITFVPNGILTSGSFSIPMSGVTFGSVTTNEDD